MRKKKIIVGAIMIVLSITAIVIAIISSSHAAYTKTDVSVNNESYKTGLLSITSSSGSDTISLLNALPISDEEGLEGEPYIINIKNTGNLNYSFDIELLTTDNNENAIDPHYIKMKYNEDEVKTLYDYSDGSSVKLNGSEKITLVPGQSMDISIRIWLSKENPSTPNNQIGKEFNGKIVITGQAIHTEGNGDISATDVSTYITNLYTNSEKQDVTSNNITYHYANIYGDNGGVMNDRLGSMDTNIDDGNIRYYGKNPNNYIYFNCTDYANQSDSTCELWRIIGVFSTDDGTGNIEKRVKIIRNESIGKYSWNTSASGINSGYGINQWGESTYKTGGTYTGSDLMKLLNPGYEDNKKDGTTTLVNNSLYWNRQSGTCFSRNNGTAGCNFATSGITNTTKGLISDAVWYLGGISSSSIYANEAYTKERGNTVVVPGTTCSGTLCNDTVTRTTTWTGKVGLMYVSDYGYATDLNKCKNTLRDYDSTCYGNDWLYNGNEQWTIVPHASNAYCAWRADIDGSLRSYYASHSKPVRPVYYLNSGLIFTKGDGTSTNPYRVMWERLGK